MDQHLTASLKMGETENESGAIGKSGNDLKMLCKGDMRYAIYDLRAFLTWLGCLAWV
jgi:hypothetical protein